MKLRSLLILSLLCVATALSRAESMSLAGEWGFTLDFQRRGEASGWPALQPADESKPLARWDVVTVPHSYSGGDPRHEHTGAAWYVRTFTVPQEWTSPHLRLRFASVGDRCRVWLNGRLLGAHDGANLPFSFDVSGQVNRAGSNVLVVETDNSFSDETIPGSRPGHTPNAQLYPWWNYGGLLGEVTLEGEPPARLARWRTQQTFNADGSVTLSFRVALENRGAEENYTLRATLTPPTTGASALEASETLRLAAGAPTERTLQLTVPAALVQRWSPDQPALYGAQLSLRSADGLEHTLTRRLGLREIAVRDGQLRLNGEPLRWAGANRSRGHPQWGGREPAELAQLDLTALKRAHLEFARLQHYPLADSMLDWADANGLLIVGESGNWQFSNEQLASPQLRALWQRHTQEMIEHSADRPSIIAWSVGNEYVSWSPEGVAWTKDMSAWVRSLDASRPVTFAALSGEMGRLDVPKEQRSLHYVDFLSFNIYSTPKAIAALDRVHARWPEKPIMISEFGQRADKVKSEEARIQHFLGTLAEVRKRPFICGLSFWTFNDYLSRYPDTTPGGYRAWGLVTGDRTPRALYAAAADALSPVQLEVQVAPDGTRATVVVTARADFPARTLRGFSLQITRAAGGPVETVALPTLAPGASWRQEIAGWTSATGLQVLRPSGWPAAAWPH